jgi:hypothetical protein
LVYFWTTRILRIWHPSELAISAQKKQKSLISINAIKHQKSLSMSVM